MFRLRTKEFLDGIIKMTYGLENGEIKFKLEADAVGLVDKGTDLIPGTWDDALFDNLVKTFAAKKEERKQVAPEEA